jgi:hypothetical protein
MAADKGRKDEGLRGRSFGGCVEFLEDRVKDVS